MTNWRVHPTDCLGLQRTLLLGSMPGCMWAARRCSVLSGKLTTCPQTFQAIRECLRCAPRWSGYFLQSLGRKRLQGQSFLFPFSLLLSSECPGAPPLLRTSSLPPCSAASDPGRLPPPTCNCKTTSFILDQPTGFCCFFVFVFFFKS